MSRKKTPEPPPVISKEFSPEEIDRGIDKLKRRIEELKAINLKVTPYNDASIESLTHRIRESIRDVFGEQSPEFRKYKFIRISHGDMPSLGFASDRDVDAHCQKLFADGIPHTIKLLDGLIDWLGEKKGDLKFNTTTNPETNIGGMNLHPRIAEVCRDLYRDEHYADAVFNASKALVNYVKERSGKFELDGAALMRTVFSKNDPAMAFSDLQDQSDLDEQEGMMHLFEGAVLALRNPRGHSFRYDTPERALEYIGLLSMLANRLAEAKRRK